MLNISALLFLSSAVLLSTWIVFEKSFIGKFIRSLFFLSFMGFVSVSFLEWTVHFSSLLSIIAKTFSLSILASVFLAFRKSKMISFFLWLMMFASIPYSYNYLIDAEKSNLSSLHNKYDPNAEILVQFGENISSTERNHIIETQFSEFQFKPAFSPDEIEITELDDYYLVNIPNDLHDSIEKILEDLQSASSIVWAEANEVLYIEPLESTSNITIPKLKFSDPLINQQWAAQSLEFEKFHGYIKKHKIKARKKAKLFVLDTGVDASHEDLLGNYRSLDSKSDTDEIGHGTHCAGIAAAVTNNKKGIASLVPDNSFVDVTSLKVLTMYGYGTQSRIIKNIIKAVDNGADVISLSLGGRSTQAREKAYNDVMKYANSKNTIVVIAAGNSSKDAATFSPANSQGVITVSAYDRNNERAFFSNTLENIKFGISAPGHEILSTYPTADQYKIFSGTSMATPYVASLAVMLKSIKPELNTPDFYRIINSSGKTNNDEVKTGRLMQPYEALKLLHQEMSN